MLAREFAALSKIVLQISIQTNSLCGKLQGQTQAPPTITATTIKRKKEERNRLLTTRHIKGCVHDKKRRKKWNDVDTQRNEINSGDEMKRTSTHTKQQRNAAPSTLVVNSIKRIQADTISE